MSRNGKRPNIGCLFYSVILVAALIIAIIAAISGAINKAQSNKYQEAMEGEGTLRQSDHRLQDGRL